MNQLQVKLASALLLVAIVACSQAFGSPMSGLDHENNQDQGDDDSSAGNSADSDGVSLPLAAAADNSGGESYNDFGGSFTGPSGGYGGGSDSLGSGQQHFGGSNFGPITGSQQAQASENSENQADDSDDANEDDDSAADFEVGGGSPGGGSSRRALVQAIAEASSQPWLEGAQLGASGEGDLEGALGADSNIANAKIEMSPHDRQTAAGHHHHHGHYVHGWLKMGAETGKKGAFKWHDKHPVGGKGR